VLSVLLDAERNGAEATTGGGSYRRGEPSARAGIDRADWRVHHSAAWALKERRLVTWHPGPLRSSSTTVRLTDEGRAVAQYLESSHG
jgi:hypothetical protein